MSNILITGATGFIGKSICKKLRNKNEYPHHMLTGTTRSRQLNSGPEHVPLYYVPEIGSETDWSQAISGANIIIHLAARVHVMQDNSTNPLKDFRNINTEGTINLARQAAASGVQRFIFISTIKVMGEISPEIGLVESDPTNPQDPYSISKLEAEKELIKIAAASGMELVILRPPLVYGPGVKGNFARLYAAILKDKILPLGKIKNKRSLIYVENLASAVALVTNYPNIGVQTFFVSDEEPLSTPDLIRKIAESLGKRPRLINLPLVLLHLIGFITGKSNIINRLTNSLSVNTAEISTQLNWQPPFSTEEGLARTKEWFSLNFKE
jgi:nucleoside-diphosphate-sugar epimerase